MKSTMTGRTPIIPRARPSIHNHSHYPFANNNMARYGRDRNRVNRERNGQTAENVRDASEDGQQPRRHEHQITMYYGMSYHSTTRMSSRTENQQMAISSGNFLSTPIVLDNFEELDKTERNSAMITIISITVVLLTLCVSMIGLGNVSNANIYNEYKFYTDITGLGEKYNVDGNSILQVLTGISRIFKSQETGSFMFVYNSDTNNFNPNEFNEFMSDVSFAASKYLRNDSIPRSFTMVQDTTPDTEERCSLISRYREDLNRTGVMLVRHIEDVPSDLAMAFHYYCDEYNPLVKRSAIFFTLNFANCSKEADNRSFHSLIENCLMKKWSTIPLDSIGPLLTRVVGVVIDVTSVF